MYHVAAEGENYPEEAFRERQAGIRGEGAWTTKSVKSSQAQPSATEKTSIGRSVPIGGHRLPPLPYPYNALEPYIDEKTMRIHHDKHHLSYVNDLNKAEKKLEEARKTGDFDLVKHWERELAFNGAGHYLHTLFWTIMSPKGGGNPSGPLAEQIKRILAATMHSKSNSVRQPKRSRVAAGLSWYGVHARDGLKFCRPKSTKI